MTSPNSDFENAVRMHIYRYFVQTGRPPDAWATSAATNLSQEEVEAAFQRLADGHVIVLEPGTLTIRMANPLSAVETPFRVSAGGAGYFGNCIWDALGVIAMLGGEGSVQTACGCCEEPMRLTARNFELQSPPDGVVHFAVPARKWWDDIIHT